MYNMNKSKLSLIIDGNWLLMSRIFVVSKQYQTDDELHRMIKRAMIIAINGVLHTFPMIDNIIFVADGGSWRKKIKQPLFMESDLSHITAYKGTRKKPLAIDIDKIYADCYTPFINELKEHCINTYHEHDVEGDDWVWYWANKLNNEGTNCIIWSKDADLSQLVKTDSNGFFTVWWNKDNGALLEEKEEDEMDFLFNGIFNENENMLHEIKKRTDYKYINPHNVVIEKIFMGDASDNILPVIKRKAASGASKREFKISAKELDYTIDIYDEQKLSEFIDSIFLIKKYDGKVTHTKAEILEHIKYNRQLVFLNEREYPQEILQILKNEKSYIPNKDTKELTTKIMADEFGIIDLLETV